ncbi:hypothetical protein [Chlorogloea sp. CCALA 695]|uniref:hypothetical protein n=1 Tax=Chlorogloea sp. CCALA 695 TaxID=2107693 RepID=UPI000D04FF48|nr:hypothetical protein [Chlorogloea sp. CCALA 695]PSB29603.1 hypothetical protein C7B70_18110 [Chlorogloea sp. CCALA 695]
MRSHYQSIIEENDQASSSARAQLNHINALLAEQLIIQQGNNQAISLPASSVDDELAIPESLQDSLTEAELPEVEDKQLEEIQPETQSFPDEFSTPSNSAPQNESQDDSVEFPITTQQVMEELKSIEDEEITSSAPLEDLAQEPTELEESITSEKVELETPVEPTKKARKPLKQPLLTQYQHLSKSEAVEKLLQEEAGNILHIDDIVRALYGELEIPTFKAEKPRLYNTLNQGIENGLWQKVPGRGGFYTVNLKQATGKPEQKPPTDSGREISALALTEALLPDYQGLKLTQAVEKVLQQNIGQAMNSEKVARVLFDEAEEDIFAAAKNKIGKALWSGANQGRWQGVPGKLGVYLLNT